MANALPGRGVSCIMTGNEPPDHLPPPQGLEHPHGAQLPARLWTGAHGALADHHRAQIRPGAGDAAPVRGSGGGLLRRFGAGKEADWFKNILANPQVHVQVGQKEFDTAAEAVTDPRRIADFIELRLRRHPLMIRLIMHLFDGLPLRFTRADLEEFCKEKALVILRPAQDIVQS